MGLVIAFMEKSHSVKKNISQHKIGKNSQLFPSMLCNICQCMKVEGGTQCMRKQRALENHCHLTESTTASKNITWNSNIRGRCQHINSVHKPYLGPGSCQVGVNMFCCRTSPCFRPFQGKTDVGFSVPKTEKDHPAVRVMKRRVRHWWRLLTSWSHVSSSKVQIFHLQNCNDWYAQTIRKWN